MQLKKNSIHASPCFRCSCPSLSCLFLRREASHCVLCILTPRFSRTCLPHRGVKVDSPLLLFDRLFVRRCPRQWIRIGHSPRRGPSCPSRRCIFCHLGTYPPSLHVLVALRQSRLLAPLCQRESRSCGLRRATFRQVLATWSGFTLLTRRNTWHSLPRSLPVAFPHSRDSSSLAAGE